MKFDGKHNWTINTTEYFGTGSVVTYARCDKCGREWLVKRINKDRKVTTDREVPNDLCHATEKLHKGSNVKVLAWWNSKRPVKCKVKYVSDEHIDVQPLEGNPHMRMVGAKDIAQES